MKRLLSFLVPALLFSGAMAIGQPITRTVDLGTDLAKGLSEAITVTNSAQTVTFSAPCSQITINNTSAANTVYFQPFGGNASTSNFPIAPGQAFTWTTTPGLTSISLYASASSTVGVLAH